MSRSELNTMNLYCIYRTMKMEAENFILAFDKANPKFNDNAELSEVMTDAQVEFRLNHLMSLNSFLHTLVSEVRLDKEGGIDDSATD